MMEDKGLPFPGPNFFESLPTYQTLLPDTWCFSFPPLYRCFCCGSFPSAPH